MHIIQGCSPTETMLVCTSSSSYFAGLVVQKKINLKKLTQIGES